MQPLVHPARDGPPAGGLRRAGRDRLRPDVRGLRGGLRRAADPARGRDAAERLHAGREEAARADRGVQEAAEGARQAVAPRAEGRPRHPVASGDGERRRGPGGGDGLTEGGRRGVDLHGRDDGRLQGRGALAPQHHVEREAGSGMVPLDRRRRGRRPGGPAVLPLVRDGRPEPGDREGAQADPGAEPARHRHGAREHREGEGVAVRRRAADVHRPQRAPQDEGPRPEVAQGLRSGGAPLPSAVVEEFARVTGGASLLEGYGLTETSPLATANPYNGERRVGSIGLPAPDTDIRLVSLDDPDTEVPDGEPGELCIKGPQVMLGYWKRPEETALAIRNEWFHSGDVAVMDPGGYFLIVDRIKDMILVSGFNVYPTEVEEVCTGTRRSRSARWSACRTPHRRTREGVRGAEGGGIAHLGGADGLDEGPRAGADRVPGAARGRVPRGAPRDDDRQGPAAGAAGGGAREGGRASALSRRGMHP